MQKMKITFNGYITVEDENGNKIDIETGSKKHKCCGNNCNSTIKENDLDLSNITSDSIKKPDLKPESIFNTVFNSFFKPKDQKDETKPVETKKTVSCSSEEREALYSLDPKKEEDENPKINIEKMLETERKAFDDKLESMLNRIIPAIEKLTDDINTLKNDYKKTEDNHISKYLDRLKPHKIEKNDKPVESVGFMESKFVKYTKPQFSYQKNK